MFVNRILALYRKNHDKKRIALRLTEFHADMQWFAQFLKTFNGKAIFQKGNVETHLVHIDACLHGFEGTWRQEEYAYKVQNSYKILILHN